MLRRTTSRPARRRLGTLVATLGLSVVVAGLPAGPASAAPGQWETVAPMANTREQHVMAPLPDGTVLVAGGISASGAYVTTPEIYDPAADTWTAAPSPRRARAGATATQLLDGRVLVFAGEPFFGESTAPSTGDVYDPVTGTWSRTPPASRFFNGQTATRLADGRVLVVGGNAVTGGRETRAEVYDPVAGTWTAVASMSTPRIAHSAVLLADGKVLVIGGVGNDGSSLASAEVYDPTTNSWATAGPPQQARDGATATRLADGRVLVAGGYFNDSASAPGEPGDDRALTSTEVYTPGTGGGSGTFATGDPLEVPRGQHAAAVLSDGDVMVTGGASGAEFAPDPSTEIYDTATGTWSTVDAMNTGRAAHTSLTLTDGTVLVVGGYEAGTYETTASVERYTPAVTAAPEAARSITITAQDTAKRGDDRLVVSGRLSVEDGPRRCVVDERVLVQRYDARSARWVRVGVDRTSGGENPGRYRLVTADVRATYRASVVERTVTQGGGSTSTCSAASAEVRHSHYAG